VSRKRSRLTEKLTEETNCMIFNNFIEFVCLFFFFLIMELSVYLFACHSFFGLIALFIPANCAILHPFFLAILHPFWLWTFLCLIALLSPIIFLIVQFCTPSFFLSDFAPHLLSYFSFLMMILNKKQFAKTEVQNC